MSIDSPAETPVVYIVDGDGDTRLKYQMLIDQLGFEMEFFASPEDVRSRPPLGQPLCLVLDLGLDGSEQLQRRWLKWDSDAPIILTTAELSGPHAVQGLGFGAVALLHRPFAIDALEEYIRFGVNQHTARIALKKKYEDLKQTYSILTRRQQRILKYAATGMPNKVIASRLQVSQRTVETERSRVLKAFDAKCLYDVTAKAGEYRVLKEIRRIQRRESLVRLGMQSLAPIQVVH